MKKIFTIAFCCFLLTAQAQVTFKEFQMPENTSAENYRLVDCYLSRNNTSNYQILYAPRIPNVVSAVEKVSEQQFNIFHNTASSAIQIRNINANGEFKIFNMHGKLMLTETITSINQSIDIQLLKPGIYIWKMENRKGKLVVQ